MKFKKRRNNGSKKSEDVGLIAWRTSQKAMILTPLPPNEQIFPILYTYKQTMQKKF